MFAAEFLIMSLFALYLLNMSKLELSCALQSVRMSLKSSGRWFFGGFFVFLNVIMVGTLDETLWWCSSTASQSPYSHLLTSEGESMNQLPWCFQERS